MSHTEFTSAELHALDEASSRPRFLLFPVLAVSGYVGFVYRLGGDSLAVQSAWILFVGYCCFCVGGVLHETVHQTLGSRRWANVGGAGSWERCCSSRTAFIEKHTSAITPT